MDNGCVACGRHHARRSRPPPWARGAVLWACCTRGLLQRRGSSTIPSVRCRPRRGGPPLGLAPRLRGGASTGAGRAAQSGASHGGSVREVLSDTPLAVPRLRLRHQATRGARQVRPVPGRGRGRAAPRGHGRAAEVFRVALQKAEAELQRLHAEASQERAQPADASVGALEASGRFCSWPSTAGFETGPPMPRWITGMGAALGRESGARSGGGAPDVRRGLRRRRRGGGLALRRGARRRSRASGPSVRWVPVHLSRDEAAAEGALSSDWEGNLGVNALASAESAVRRVPPMHGLGTCVDCRSCTRCWPRSRRPYSPPSDGAAFASEARLPAHRFVRPHLGGGVGAASRRCCTLAYTMSCLCRGCNGPWR